MRQIPYSSQMSGLMSVFVIGFTIASCPFSATTFSFLSFSFRLRAHNQTPVSGSLANFMISGLTLHG